MSAINIAAAMISETAREENGPTKGSESAKMQSQLTKAQNAKKGNAIASTELDSKNAPHPSKNTQRSVTEGLAFPDNIQILMAASVSKIVANPTNKMLTIFERGQLLQRLNQKKTVMCVLTI